MTCQPPITDQLMTFGGILWQINGTNLYLTGPLVRAGKVHASVRSSAWTSWAHYHGNPDWGAGLCHRNLLIVCFSFFSNLISQHVSNKRACLFSSKPDLWHTLHCVSSISFCYVQSVIVGCVYFCSVCVRACVCVSHSLPNCLIRLLHQQLSLEH